MLKTSPIHYILTYGIYICLSFIYVYFIHINRLLFSFFISDDVDRLKPQKRGILQALLCCWRRNRTKTNQNGTQIDGSTTPPPLPDQQRYLLPQVRHSDMHKKCMVIDLDETLVHSSFKVRRSIRNTYTHTCISKPLYPYIAHT